MKFIEGLWCQASGKISLFEIYNPQKADYLLNKTNFNIDVDEFRFIKLARITFSDTRLANNTEIGKTHYTLRSEQRY